MSGRGEEPEVNLLDELDIGDEDTDFGRGYSRGIRDGDDQRREAGWLDPDQAAQLRAELAAARAKIVWVGIYHLDGRCRECSGRDNPGEHQRGHAMWCLHYIGPLKHRWTHKSINDTFGGVDYRCTCGGWFRQGGIAGHGDGTEQAEPVCPNADQQRRGGTKAGVIS